MLAADKLQLQSALKQQATALKEKEFNLHHSNLMTVGTQAAVLAGLDVTMFIEFQPPHDTEWGDAYLLPRALKFFYYCTITAAFCANMLVVGQTTVLAVLGTSLALRGPDGSMMTATDGLYEERRSVFAAFGYGLCATIGSVLLCVWLILSPEAAAVCMGVTLFTCLKMYRNYLRVTRRFEYDESQTVDFHDIFEGPAAIRAVPIKRQRGGGGSRGAAFRDRSDRGGKVGRGVGRGDAVVLKRKNSHTYDTDDSDTNGEGSATDAMIPNGSSHHGSSDRGRGSRGTRTRRRPSPNYSDLDYDGRDVEQGSPVRVKDAEKVVSHLLTV